MEIYPDIHNISANSFCIFTFLLIKKVCNLNEKQTILYLRDPVERFILG